MTRDVPVLVIGGSLVGLSTALLLGHHGVPALVVEHHRGTAIHPRAAQITQRSMEILRIVGIEQVVRQTSETQFVQDGAIMAAETLAGKELAYFIANLNDGIRDVSPTERVFISQSLLEPLLKARAEALGADLRFATDLVSFEQDANGVTATIRHRDTGVTEDVRAQYLVACDGAHSRIRQQLGIGLSGHGVFSKSITIYFRANVAPLLRGRNLSVIYINNQVLRGFFRFEKPFDSGFLAVNALGDPSAPITDVATGLTPERARELIHVALGADDVDVVVENMMPWEAQADVADVLRRGRVFLAGDSAHVMPPNGGFGGNTGVQDADNLAWKLAMVLEGTAGADLLDTYEAERRPVGVFTTEQAYSRYVARTAPYLGTEGTQPVAPDLDVELGYGYTSNAIEDDGVAAPLHVNPRESGGRPGTRAPHVWLADGRSTLDLFGRGFVLIAGRDGSPWLDAVGTVAASLGLAMDAHRIGSGGLSGDDSLESAFGITPSGAALVRPDGFVAWRAVGTTATRSATQVLAAVMDRILATRRAVAG